MSNQETYQMLARLERSLHSVEVSKDKPRLQQLLHPRFKQISRSGK